jgi:hypothetical protein
VRLYVNVDMVATVVGVIERSELWLDENIQKDKQNCEDGPTAKE